MSSRVIRIKKILDRKVCHVVSAYAPQGGRSEEENAEFWGTLDDRIGRISEENLLKVQNSTNFYPSYLKTGNS